MFYRGIENQKLAKIARQADAWDLELLKELCNRADMLDERDAADGGTFETVALEAAEKLGVEIL